MNNEPVAWAVWEGRPHDLFFTKEDADELCRLKGGDAKSVPLYTHPVKELPNNHQYIAQLEMTVRNQQAEIEALKAGKIRAYDNGVEDGRKPNTHPANPYQSITNTKIEPTVVSYTHPVKELTDEEIEKIAEEFKDVDYTLDDEEAFDVFNHRGFARAILRKAQEK